VLGCRLLFRGALANPMEFRRTKIICTIGPATASYDMLEELQRAGMNVVRLNMSHADHASAAKIVGWVRTLNRKVHYPVAILLDTQGPEIRTGVVAQPMVLNTGDVVSLTVRGDVDVEHQSIQVNYDDLVTSVKVGDRITIDNGLINFDVLGKDGPHLTCRVVDGGTLGSKRHVNLPGVRVNLPSITEKDVKDIRWGMANDIDFIALSFVRSADDIIQLRALLGSKAQGIKIIAKIEDREGVAHLDEIARAADGVMVARGDLGIETNIAEMPNLQRTIVRKCAVLGRRCIVATHLLESMISNPIPTRAEVTDVANAIYEGVDAVMLSGETGIGRYPVRCVRQLDEIARTSERLPGLGFEQELVAISDKQHLATSAARLAESINAAGIVVITRRGIMADLVTNCRPRTVPIYAFTNNSQTRRRLVMNRSVISFRTAFSTDPEKTLATAFKVLMQREGLAPDAKVVVISDVLAQQRIDAIQIRPLDVTTIAPV
jgi:pyruvate kinase